jgi:hypothetical protein
MTLTIVLDPYTLATIIGCVVLICFIKVLDIKFGC